jgi:hypothetical protein
MSSKSSRASLSPAGLAVSYVECDVPEGVTLAYWRRSREADARAGRRRRPALVRLFAAA